MRILLSNDDGINAQGLQTLRKTLAKNFKVTVVAPDREKSASGHGITVHKPLRVEKTVYEDGSEGFAVNGTPADCVKLAVEELLKKPPEFVISGINSGANLGTDVLYSGTVSAAVEGLINGIPSIAVSLVTAENYNYQLAADFVKDFIPKISKKKLPHNTIININVPDIKEEALKGVKVTKLGVRRYINSIDKRIDPRGKVYYWIAGEVKNIDTNPDDNFISDFDAVQNNYISITPVNFDLNNFEIIDSFKKWFNQ